MNRIQWKELFEAAGMLAIVASLIFVGLQVRQDQVIARSQLFSDGVASVDSFHQALMEPEFAKTYATMLDRPEELSVEEMLQINGLLNQLKNMMKRECYLVERGLFPECANFILPSLRHFFGSKYAQSWWRVNRTPTRYLPDWIDEEIASLETDRIRRGLDDVKAGL